jgi:hypothetical protein
MGPLKWGGSRIPEFWNRPDNHVVMQGLIPSAPPR